MSAHRRTPADPMTGRFHGSLDLSTTWPTDSLAGMSASLAAADGTLIASVSRYTEAPPPGAPDSVPLVVVAVEGDLDRDTCDLLDMALTSAIDANIRVCCDLRRLDFLAAAGVRVMFAAHQRAVHRGHRLSLRGAHGSCRQVLILTGMHQVLHFED